MENNGTITTGKSLDGHYVLIWYYGDNGSLSPNARKRINKANGAKDLSRVNYVDPRAISLDLSKAFYEAKDIASAMSLRALLDEELMNQVRVLIENFYPETYKKRKPIYEKEMVNGKMRTKLERDYEYIDNGITKYRKIKSVTPVIKDYYYVTATREEHLQYFVTERNKKAQELVKKIFDGEPNACKYAARHPEIINHPEVQKVANEMEGKANLESLRMLDTETKKVIAEAFKLSIGKFNKLFGRAVGSLTALPSLFKKFFI